MPVRRSHSTVPGHVNAQGQRVLRRLGPSMTAGQYIYELECEECHWRYGAIGYDIDGAGGGAGRKCPNHQGGAPGEQITTDANQNPKTRTTKTQTIYRIAQDTADQLPDMFRRKGPGEGNHFTNRYMSLLNKAVVSELGRSCVEQKICGDTDQCVDFYVPEESTIVEVELSLYNVHTNLDRDVFKALLAKDAGHLVSTLLLIGKEPAKERHNQPASRALIDFVKRHHGLTVVIEELRRKREP